MFFDCVKIFPENKRLDVFPEALIFGEVRKILKPIIFDTLLSEISEIVGTGKVPDDSRMLPSACSVFRGQLCEVLRWSPTLWIPPKMNLRREYQALLSRRRLNIESDIGIVTIFICHT